MDQISVESSSSSNSSCSLISYQGTDGYISDGEDPFVQPIELTSSDDQQFMSQVSDNEQSFIETDVTRQKTEADYAQQRRKRQKKQQEKQILNELKFGRNTTLLLNLNPLVPRYQEITKIIQEVRSKYSLKSFQLLIERLHSQLVLKPKQKARSQRSKQYSESSLRNFSQIDLEKREKWLAQRRVAAMAFVQLGYGITKMRKFVQQNQINMQMQFLFLLRDIVTYQQIIVKLLKDAYRRLEKFLRKKCHKKVLKLTTPTEEKYLLEILKDCRHKLDKFQIHNFLKLIKPTYIKNEQFKISKRIASRLYHSCKEYISRKKIKVGLINLDNPDCQIFNNDKAKWTPQMIQTAVNIYTKEGSLNRVREIMSKTSDVELYLIDNRNTKYHIAKKVQEGLNILKAAIQKNRTTQNFKAKELIELNSEKISDIINHVQAINIRMILLEIYQLKEPTKSLLNDAILAINEFVPKRESDKMRQQVKQTYKQFDPYEYQFQKRRRAKRR